MFISKKSGKALSVALLALFVTGTAVNAMAADGKWKQNHPRRAQVNHRLNNQNKRINNEVKSGQISKQQGQQMHKEDHQIRTEERSMASQNGGHITKQEQSTLNHQENGVSKQIGQ